MQGTGSKRAPISPKYWQDGLDAEIFRPIVKQYLEQGILDAEGIAVMRAYLRYWIDSPIWNQVDTLRDLRDRVAGIEDAEDVQAWLRDARKLGIVPL